MHFRILKMIATSGFLTALECTKSFFSRGSASKGGEGKGKKRGEGPLTAITGSAPALNALQTM